MTYKTLLVEEEESWVVVTMNSLSADAQEGIAAFLEKRPPVWQGR